MKRLSYLKAVLICGASVAGVSQAAYADHYNIPGGDLVSALAAYSSQTGVELIVSDEQIRGTHTNGARGELTASAALAHILAGTGFTTQRDQSGAVGIVRQQQPETSRAEETLYAETAPAHAAASVETVVVTSSKIKGDIQTVPIAITALSQEQLTSRQIAGGPDLVKEVPNLTFSKTNFTGYNIEIRGIGTQAISVTTDPAVAVAFNDIPFIRNHFFEQEFYDVSQVEVLRGPQGTLYGRNATAGVVNLISAKPTEQFEMMLSADAGNYNNRRFEGMINIPVVDDRLDIRAAAEWTKRDGYSFNSLTSSPIDGRDLWSGRLTIGFKPFAKLQTYLVWEHFQENDDRIRSSKQLCKTDHGLIPSDGDAFSAGSYLSQGCLPSSLYSADAFEVPNGYALPYFSALANLGVPVNARIDPYASTVQSRNLRVIESTLNPTYRAKNDTIELAADYTIDPELTLTSQTGFNHDFLWSTEDYNRFNTQPGAFIYSDPTTPNGNQRREITPDGGQYCNNLGFCRPTGTFCDPQLGCSDRLVAEDLSDEHAWQFSQEFRLASNFLGPLNFSVGGNLLHYETEENYYVFINTLTLYAVSASARLNAFQGPADYQWVPNVSDNHQCLIFDYEAPGSTIGSSCDYIDPNPITSLNNQGHNYFLSQNPYVLNSYAGFGEAYYNVTSDLKLTVGVRWTDDEKHFIDIPSEVIVESIAYPSTGVVDQKWNQWTGRFNATWTPKLDFTDQTLIYGSFAHGYKAGGANPPGAVLLRYNNFDIISPIHPLTFKPEFIDAYEAGTKNTLLDGALVIDATGFYYDYKGYQISRIVDRTSINDNFDATVRGAELETSWEPALGLKFSFAGGYEDARLAKGSKSIDLIDRADSANHPDWIVVKPFPTQASNCVLPLYVINYMISNVAPSVSDACANSYVGNLDPATGQPYVANPTTNAHGDPIPPGAYAGFDPLTAPNNGEGFDKDLSGNQLPNAPHITASLTAEYTVPVSDDWAATMHGDFYWQSQSFARVFNDRPYDKLRGYSNVNLALIFTGADGWQVLGYLKNIFNTTAITGDFLNSDDTGLTTNVFLTDPRLYGVRITKNF